MDRPLNTSRNSRRNLQARQEENQQGQEPAFNFGQYEVILSLPQGNVEFAGLLEKSGKERLTILYKNLKHLLEPEQTIDNDTRCMYLYIILKAVSELTVAVSRLDRDELRDLVHGFLTEARHYPTKILTKFVSDCLERLKTSTESNNSPEWVEMFGRIVGLLTKRGSVEFEDDIHSGKQFKSEVIYAILRIKWTSQNAPSLVASMREIGIEDVELLLRKVSTSLESMDPNSVPPLTYQLLTVLGDAGRFSQFMNILDEYFNKIPTDVREAAKKCKVLGTVVFHFAHATKVTPNLRQKILRRVKLASSDLVTKRFSLGVSLCLTQFEDIRSMVVTGLKGAIVKGFLDANLRKESLWYQNSCETEIADPIECFQAILQSKSSELEFMLEGFKELGLGLVNMEEKDGLIQEKCGALASLILMYVLRISKEEFGSIALKLLRNKNLTSIGCLAELTKGETRALLDPSNTSKVYELVHQLPQLSLDLAVPLVQALLPALDLSHALMGEALLIFRKSLWKSIEARRVSVSTMVMLLSKLKIKSATPDVIPQRQFMLDSQATVDPDPPAAETVTMNQLLCSEIVSILGRFFSHGNLRDFIYLGLEPMLLKNLDLINDISAQLLHCLKFHMSDDGKTLAVFSVFQSPQEEGPGQFSVLEDLGLLFQAVASMIRIAEREYVSESWPGPVLQCQKLLNAAGTDILTFGFEKFESCAEGLRNFGGSPETTRYVRNILIDQWLQIIEALMEHLLRGGKLNPNLTITVLYEKCQQFLKLLKEIGIQAQKKDKTTASKKSKTKSSKDSNKQNDANATDTASTSTTSTKSSKVSTKLVPIKDHMHIITLESVQFALESLYKDQGDDSPFKLVQNSAFEDYIFQVIGQKLKLLKEKKPIKEFNRGQKFLVKVFLLIVRQLLDRIMKCIEAEDGTSSLHWNDDDVVLLEAETGNVVNNRRLQLIVEILQFIDKHTDFRDRIMQFMSLDKTSNYETDFRKFYRDYWLKLLARFQIADVNMMGLEYLMAILSILLPQLLPSSQMADQAWEDFGHWLQSEGPAEEKATPCLTKHTVQCLVAVRNKIPHQSDALVDLARNARSKLGNNDETLETAHPVRRTWIITEETANEVVDVVGSWVQHMLTLLNSVVSKIKSRSSFVSSKDLICSWFDQCTTMLNEIVNIMMELAGCNFCVGSCGVLMLKVSTQFFTTVTSITDEICQFITWGGKDTFDLSRFKKFVKNVGRDFKQRVDNCVQYIEQIDREEACEAQKKLKASKKKNGKKVNMKIVHKFSKDAKTIPALVFSVEKYDLQILRLAKKLKTDLFVGTRLNAARDFRIEMSAIKRAMEAADSSASTSNASRNVTNAEESRANSTGGKTRKRKAPAADPEMED